MKAITTLFESMLGSDDTIVWTPTDGRTQAFEQRGWGWGG
jgi:hypothetical protein